MKNTYIIHVFVSIIHVNIYDACKYMYNTRTNICTTCKCLYNTLAYIYRACYSKVYRFLYNPCKYL